MNSLSLQPGRLVRISEAVQRLVAPNASLMTGPGTNSYVLGTPPTAVLDPGPDDPGHLDLLRQAVPRPRFIFVTHTHRDHSCGARILAQATGAPIVGLTAPRDGLQDDTCVPDIHPADDEVFALGGQGSGDARGRLGSSSPRPGEPGQPARSGAAAPHGRAIHAPAVIRLRAIHTPGHASNHICYLLEEEQLLFSGDHVLDGMTPVILPPDGDMAAYLHSLSRLKTYGARVIAPGHGDVLSDPRAAIDGVIAHRARREAKVVAALGEHGRARLDDLLPKVYDDVRAELLPLARHSLEAHLIKLVREGRAGLEGGVWLAPGAAGPGAGRVGPDLADPG